MRIDFRALMLAICLTAPAQATISVALRANGPSGPTLAYSTSKDHQNAKRMSGRASSSASDKSSIVEKGKGAFCAFEDDCADLGSSPFGLTSGYVDMNRGLIRQYATASDAGSGLAQLGFSDLITFGSSRTVTLSLDIPMLSHAGPGNGSGSVSLLVYRDSVNPSEEEDVFLFFQAVTSEEGSSYHYTGIGGSGSGSGPIPNSFEFVLEFFDLDPLLLAVDMNVSASCSGTPCKTTARSDSSLYVGIADRYSSQSGYSYLGVTSDPEVPEPSTLFFSISGLTLLLARRSWNRGVAAGPVSA